MRRDATNKHASSSPYFLSTAQPKAAVGQTSLPSPSVLVFGSAAIDLTSSSLLPLSPRSTTPGSIYLSPGGVGRNIAEAAQNLLPPSSVQLVSVIGRQNPATDVAEPDGLGKLLISELLDCGMRTDGLVMSDVAGKSTAACSLTLERDGDLVAGVADMGIIQTMTSEMVSAL